MLKVDHNPGVGDMAACVAAGGWGGYGCLTPSPMALLEADGAFAPRWVL